MKETQSMPPLPHYQRRAVFIMILVLSLAYISGKAFLQQHKPEQLIAGPGVSACFQLSKWHPDLLGTRSDSKVFYLSPQAMNLDSSRDQADFSQKPKGGRVLILGGVHPNEPAAYLAAVLLLENLEVNMGSIYLIPRANASAFTATEPQEGHPQTYSIEAKDGSMRWFRMGSRLTNPLDQWPDPEIAIHQPSGQHLAGNETRNLNRCFPGDLKGSRTQQVAGAIHQLIRTEEIDLVIDLHEASIEYPVINAIVAHETAGDLAAAAIFDLEMKGIQFTLEPSPKNLHGLSHRELGDHLPGLFATLMESANPIQGRLRGKTSTKQILEGVDPCYVEAGEAGMNQVPFDSTGIPIERRVMRHIEGVQSLIAALDWVAPEKSMRLTGLPKKNILLKEGLTPYLNPTP
jgi:hypothetical protein